MAIAAMDNLRALFRKRLREQSQTDAKDVRELVLMLADSSPGAATPEFAYYAEVLQREGLTDADLEASLAEFLSRRDKARIAAKADELRESAEAAEVAFRRADLEEGQRRLEAHRRLQALELEMQTRCEEANRAETARQDLIASAATSPEEESLARRQVEIGAAIAKLDKKLAANLPGVDAAPLYPQIGVSPGALCTRTKAELRAMDDSTRRAADTPELRRQLKERLRIAEAECATLERERQSLIRERERNDARLAELAADKLKPESFRIIRVTPTRDELRRQHAASLGLGRAGDGVNPGFVGR